MPETYLRLVLKAILPLSLPSEEPVCWSQQAQLLFGDSGSLFLESGKFLVLLRPQLKPYLPKVASDSLSLSPTPAAPIPAPG